METTIYDYQTEKKVRQLNIMTAVFLTITVSMILLSPCAKASGLGDLPTFMAKQIMFGVYDPIISIINGGSPFNNFYTMAIGNVSATNGGFTGDLSALNNIGNAIIALGMAIIVINSFVKMFQSIGNGKQSDEALYECLAQIGICGMILSKSRQLSAGIMGVGDQFIHIINNTLNIGTQSTQGEDQIVSDLFIAMTGQPSGGFLWQLQAIMTLIVPFVASYLLALVMQAQIVQMIFELAVRRVFIPIAVADIYTEGLRSSGMQYIKKMLITFIKITIIILVVFISQKAMLILTNNAGSVFTSGTAMKDAFPYLGRILVLEFTTVGVAHSATSIASDVLS